MPSRALVPYRQSLPPFIPKMSLLHLFPVELLSEVFVHCLPSDLEVSNSDELPRFPDRGFLYLCEIDHTTRAVATTTPELWTFIRVRIPQYKPEYYTPRLAVPFWIDRSGILPLQLELCQEKVIASDPWAKESRRATRSIFESFSKAFWHCKHLRLDVASRTLTRPFITTGASVSSHQLQIPVVQETHSLMLESLEVNFIDTDAFTTQSIEPDSSRIMTINLCAPLLHSISGSYILDSANWKSSLPWEQLTELTLRMNDVSTCVEVLGHCPELNRYHLDIDTAGRDMLHVLSLEPHAHTCLKSFHVLGPAHDLELLFLKLKLPSLVDLKVQKSDWFFGPHHFPTTWPQMQFIGMLERSECKLEGLKLLYTGMNEEELKEISNHATMRELRDFGMGENWAWPCTLRKALMEGLTVAKQDGGHIVLGSLDSLSVYGVSAAGHDSCEDGVVALMVQSRWQSKKLMASGKEATTTLGKKRDDKKRACARLTRLMIQLPEENMLDRAALVMLKMKGMAVTLL